MERENEEELRQEWVYREYVNREDMVLHAPFEPEMDFYHAVAQGRTEDVKEYLKTDFLKKEGLGKLSSNALRNGKYHFVITAALVARYCVEGGMPMEESYSMSDFYIQKADVAETLNALTLIHDRMVLDYAEKMNRYKESCSFSKKIEESLGYIYSHLHTRITLKQLAEAVGYSPSYLSREFRKETGKNVGEYISKCKIDTAINMLRYSEYTPAQIAMILAYPSQSYFTECFRKATGTTPMKYARK